jgi:hypothetical protein
MPTTDAVSQYLKNNVNPATTVDRVFPGAYLRFLHAEIALTVAQGDWYHLFRRK